MLPININIKIYGIFYLFPRNQCSDKHKHKKQLEEADEAGRGRRGGSSEGLWGEAIRGARRRARVRERREKCGGSRLETVGRARRGVSEA